MRAPSQEPVKIGAVDVEAFSRNLARVIEEGGRALAAYLKPREQGQGNRELAEELNEVAKTLGQVAHYWLADPKRALELQTRFGKAYLDLWASAAKRLAGEPATPVASPAPNDKRFNDPEWTSNQFFDFLKQLYLLSTRLANQLVNEAKDLDPHTRQKAEFYVRQIANAISPSNFVLTNPELLRETITSNAENLVRGMHMLAEDIQAGGGDLKHTPVRCLDVRGRPQPRGHARQSDLPERHHAAHPVCAFDRKGAEEAAADRAALDQQILCARPDAGKIVHQVVRRPGHHRLLHFLGQSGRPPRPKKLGRVYPRRPAGGDRRHQARDRRRQGPQRSAIASAARCWPLRSPPWPRSRTSASSRRPFRRPGRLHLCGRP